MSSVPKNRRNTSVLVPLAVVRVRMFGNTAIGTWLDQGVDLLGRFSQGRFTVVLARRGDVWQMVHIQTSGVKRR